MSEHDSELSLTDICRAVSESLYELVHEPNVMEPASARKENFATALENLMLMLLSPAGPMGFKITFDRQTVNEAGLIETSRESVEILGETLEDAVTEFKQLHPSDLLNRYIIQEVEPL